MDGNPQDRNLRTIESFRFPLSSSGSVASARSMESFSSKAPSGNPLRNHGCCITSRRSVLSPRDENRTAYPVSRCDFEDRAPAGGIRDPSSLPRSASSEKGVRCGGPELQVFWPKCEHACWQRVWRRCRAFRQRRACNRRAGQRDRLRLPRRRQRNRLPA